MKALSPALAGHIAGPVTTLATCWSITRRDGKTYFFTDHDRDLEIDGTPYLANSGYSRSAVATRAGLDVDTLEVEAIFDHAVISAQEMRAGLFDFASVRVFLVNWDDPGMGTLMLRRGWFGEVTLSEAGLYRTELRGLTQVLSQTIGELSGPECRADLGDARCGIDISGPEWTRPGTVLGVTDAGTFSAEIIEPRATDGWFNGGLLTWQTGQNAGRAIEVKTWVAAGGQVTLFLAMGYAIQAGDTFTVYPGCDKRRATCIAQFDNILNFRGEPFVPGLDAVLEYPDAS